MLINTQTLLRLTSVLVSTAHSLGCPWSVSVVVMGGVHSLDFHDVLCMVKETCAQQLHSTERTER